MAEFPYTPSPASLRKFLAHIQGAGVPTKVTQAYLKSVGFKSSNDRYLLTVLKFIDFLDSSGTPTPTWKQYRDKAGGPAAMAAAIRAAYSDLFVVYPDAYRKDDEALLNYFTSHTTLAKATLTRVVATFKTLCAHAGFETLGQVGATAGTVAVETPVSGQGVPPPPPAVPSITIAIQLQLPATDNAAVYDNLFAAMKRHLFS